MGKFIYKQYNDSSNYSMFYSSRKKAVDALVCTFKAYNCITVTTIADEYFTHINGTDSNGITYYGYVEKLNLH